MEHEKVIIPDMQDGEILLTRALIETASYNIEENTVDVVFATNNPILLKGKDGVPFWEVLSFAPEHIRQQRLSAGLPVLDNHKRDGSVRKDVLGRTTGFSLHGTYGTATIKFSNRAELEDFRKDVKEGIIVDVSAGYRVYMYREITADSDIYTRYLAIDWEPSEISMVPVPADYNTRVRSLPQEIEKPHIEHKQEPVTQQRAMEKTPEQIAAEQSQAEATLRTEAANAERTRSLEIMDVTNKAGLDNEFATKHINDGTSVDQVRALAIEHFAKEKKQDPINANVDPAKIVVGEDKERAQKLAGLEEAIQIRVSGSIEGGPKTELGKRALNRRLTMMDHARGFVEVRFGAIEADKLTDADMLTRALTSTDYPIAMANVMNNSLVRTYQSVDPVWKKFATKVTANDFKDIYSTQVDGSFVPDELTEQGEYTEAKFVEAGDKFNLRTWGKMVKLSRKMIINDNLGAFKDTAPKFAKGFVNRQARIVYDLLTSNGGVGRTLGRDGLPLFDAAHGNYAGPGAVMSLTSYNLARVAMQRQKDLSGEPILITPKFLVIPPELETLADQLINSTITPNTTSQANPFKGAFEILVDPYLTDTKAWYIIADPSEIDIIKYAVLQGQEGLFTEHMYDFNTDELKIKVRGDFNATIDEYRGIYKNAGGN